MYAHLVNQQKHQPIMSPRGVRHADARLSGFIVKQREESGGIMTGSQIREDKLCPRLDYYCSPSKTRVHFMNLLPTQSNSS